MSITMRQRISARIGTGLVTLALPVLLGSTGSANAATVGDGPRLASNPPQSTVIVPNPIHSVGLDPNPMRSI